MHFEVWGCAATTRALHRCRYETGCAASRQVTQAPKRTVLAGTGGHNWRTTDVVSSPLPRTQPNRLACCGIGAYWTFHLMEQPMLAICSCGPIPVDATCLIASYSSRRVSGPAGWRPEASRRPRY